MMIVIHDDSNCAQTAHFNGAPFSLSLPGLQNAREEMMKKYVHSIRFTVPFADVDMMGHVNNVRYLTYFETARAEHMHNLTTGREELATPGVEPSRLGVILARAEIDYKHPARWMDVLVVKMRTISVGKSSWTYEYEIEREKDRRVIAVGKSVQVAYDYTKGRPIPIPEKVRSLLLREVDETKEEE
jgi:YbgC/YbaW family acyl-CoA thioester hydrolase